MTDQTRENEPKWGNCHKCQAWGSIRPDDGKCIECNYNHTPDPDLEHDARQADSVEE